MQPVPELKIQKIVDLTTEDYITLHNVFIYVLPDKGLHNIIYDEKCRYTLYYDGNYVEKHSLTITPPDFNKTEYTEIDEAYSCLYQGAIPPSHNYMQFVKSYGYLARNKVATMLVYDVDNGFYNSFNRFVVEHLADVGRLYKCTLGKLYKIKTLTLGVHRPPEANNFSFFSKKLDQIIPIKDNRVKYFNIKLQQNAKENWTGARCFKNDDYVLGVLNSRGYNQLDLSSEFAKQVCLRNSSYLILSYGGNIHINCNSLYNKNKPILILCHKDYNHEYNYSDRYKTRVNGITDDTYSKNLVRWVFDLPDEPTNLDEIIDKFEIDYAKYL